MSGRRFAWRNLFSKHLAWLLSFHFQFSLQGEKIITLNNNLQKKRKGFVVPTQMKMRRLDWTEVGAALHKTWARNTDETQNHTCIFLTKNQTKPCAFKPSYLNSWCKIYRCVKWGTDSGTVVNLWLKTLDGTDRGNSSATLIFYSKYKNRDELRRKTFKGWEMK